VHPAKQLLRLNQLTAPEPHQEQSARTRNRHRNQRARGKALLQSDDVPTTSTVAYHKSVFLNVPFDRSYKRLFEAAVFAICDCGFIARSASEDEDSSTPRVEKIYKLIQDSKYGIHDISRVTLDTRNRLPRFNMPLELGIWLGAKRYGSERDRNKRALVFDKVDHRYQKFCSDISGQDIRSHNNDPAIVIRKVRNWLRNSPEFQNVTFPGPEKMVGRYAQFRAHLRVECKLRGLNWRDLEFNDYSTLVVGWLKINPL
jgi:hypothetical protein